jgi:hypothetical protein
MEAITANLLITWSQLEPHRCYRVADSMHFIVFIKKESYLIIPYLYSEPALVLKDQCFLEASVTFAIKQDADLIYQTTLIRGQHTYFKTEISDSHLNINSIGERKELCDSLLESYTKLRQQQILLKQV